VLWSNSMMSTRAPVLVSCAVAAIDVPPVL
jgi:hypothetical protein